MIDQASSYKIKLTEKELIAEIINFKKEQNAVILAHFYQNSGIQDIADFVGDSLDLSRKAQATNADTILFCGVKFMAEVAKILSPEKKVLIPDFNAGCSLESSCKPQDFALFKKKYPNAIVITYINCSAEIKSMSDIIVTSTNAKKIIDQIPLDQQIIFAPDRHLGNYINKITSRNMILWHGSCIIHEQFSEKELIKLKTNHPNSIIIAHPECPENLLFYANHIGSTSSLLQFTSQNQGKEFIILTEPGIIHQMKLKNPTGIFHECNFINQSGCSMCNSCHYMKLNNLEKIYLVLKNNSKKYEDKNYLIGGEVKLEENLRLQARNPLIKMLEMS